MVPYCTSLKNRQKSELLRYFDFVHAYTLTKQTLMLRLIYKAKAELSLHGFNRFMALHCMYYVWLYYVWLYYAWLYYAWLLTN